MDPLAILSTGMVTGVGFSTEASCAAIRVGITGFVDTDFKYDAEFIQGCPVPFETPMRGRQKLIEMAVLAVEQAIEPIKTDQSDLTNVPFFLCLSRVDRPGRLAGLDHSMLQEISQRLGQQFSPASEVIAENRIGGVTAMTRAHQLMGSDRTVRHVLICGVDSLLTTRTLDYYYSKGRLLTAENSNGFIPGEAASAVVLSRYTDRSDATLAVTGIGYGDEPAPIDSEKPFRADGLVAAIRQAMGSAEIDYEQLAYRLTDNSGEQFGFKESVLAMTRLVRPVKPEFDIEHPADCIGEVGAATVPILLAAAEMAEKKSYAPGRFMGDGVFCHVSDDGSSRAAFVLRAVSELRNNIRSIA